jgi:hypothetical protein
MSLTSFDGIGGSGYEQAIEPNRVLWYEQGNQGTGREGIARDAGTTMVTARANDCETQQLKTNTTISANQPTLVWTALSATTPAMSPPIANVSNQRAIHDTPWR